MYDLTVSFHKGTCASSHLRHNNRTIYVPHADPSQKHLNVSYIDMTVEEAYHRLFDDALVEYNKDKKPSRQIKDYYQHILQQYQKGHDELQRAISSGASKAEQRRIKSKYPKVYYEVIVSIGNSDCYDGAFSVLGEKSELTAQILKRYMETFQKRNPHLYVFSAHLHRDETGDKNGTSKAGVGHLHLCYIPWTDLPGRGLPVRVSENGAFTQQGLTSGKRGDMGTVRFQEQERQVLTEISKEYGINIVAGKHSKKHLSKEEYILRQEQEKSDDDRVLIDAQAGELLQYQDELLDYIRTNRINEAFSEHIELVALKQEQAEADVLREQNKAIITSYWNDYKQFTTSFFVAYRANKGALWDEIKKAKQSAVYNKKQLSRLLFDITEGTDILLIKLIKLFVALFLAIKNIQYEKQLEDLQKANKLLKQQAKDIINQSETTASVLKDRDLERIQNALKSYEVALNNAIQLIHTTMQENLIDTSDKQDIR